YHPQILKRAGVGTPRIFPPRDPSDHKVRIGFATVGCFLGGAERWISDLLEYLDRDRVRVVGVAYKDAIAWAPTIPTVRADWERHCPVAEGMDAIRDLAL